MDTLLTALYVKIDDMLVKDRRSGHPVRLSPSELVCLAVAQAMPIYHSEAAAGAKAAKRAARRARPTRPQGGQKGHPGASLAWTARPYETLAVEPGTCGGCGADLAGAAGRVASAVQVLDIPPAALTVTEYQMMSRTCGCGQVTTAPAPAEVTGGPVC
jgi:hypothetical protein